MQTVFPPIPPILHYRVKPMGGVYDQQGQLWGFLKIDYLTLWNRDDGLDVGWTCSTNLGFLLGLVGLGSSYFMDGLKAHDIDDERSAVLVAAPGAYWSYEEGIKYNLTSSAYLAFDYFAAAHEDEPTDKSTYFTPSEPQPAGTHLYLYLTRSKHATYFGNDSDTPDHEPLIPGDVIAAVYIAIDGLYLSGAIDYWTYLVPRQVDHFDL
ncbi:MAG: hypothetical protein ACE15E_20975 [Acidobacteriota bacterium]